MENTPEMTEGAARAHAVFAPSGMKANLSCRGKVAMEEGLPDSSSIYSAEGSVAHLVAAECLERGLEAVDWIGEEIEYEGFTIEIDETFAENVQCYVDAIRNKAESYDLMGAARVELMVEVKVPIQNLTGEAGATGTSDAIMLVDWGDGTGLIDVCDLKFGRGVVVHPEENDQGLSYAFGAIEVAKTKMPEVKFTRVLIGIHQPRIRKHLSEWECSVEYLMQWAATRVREGIMDMRVAMERKRHEGVESILSYLNPSEENCQFCKAFATCPAGAAKVQEEVLSMFEDCTDQFQGQKMLAESDLPRLEQAGLGLELAEMWLRAVRSEIERRLLAGVQMEHHKLVMGREGNRKFSSKDAAEKLLREVFRLPVEDAYTLKLISPTQAERLADKKIGKLGPRQWKKLQELIVRNPPKPSVALMDDPAEAVAVEKATDLGNEFDVVTELSSVLDDLC